MNALAILIFLAQLPELDPSNVPELTFVFVLMGLAIIYLMPLLTNSIPSPLINIIFLTIICITLDLDLRTVGDMGRLPDTLPMFLLPDIPITFET